MEFSIGNWQQQTTKAPGSGPIDIALSYPKFMKVAPEPSPDNYGVFVKVLPPSSMVGRGQGAWRPLSLYLNLELAGQVNTSADNPELNTALKKLVDNALKSLKQLEESLAKQKSKQGTRVP